MYIATYDQYQGQGSTLILAFKDLEDNYGDTLSVEECQFFNGIPLKVVQEIKTVTVPVLKKSKNSL